MDAYACCVVKLLRLIEKCVTDCQVLRDFPHATSNISPEYLFDMIGPLRPRAFSIASSQKVCLVAGSAHCLVCIALLTNCSFVLFQIPVYFY